MLATGLVNDCAPLGRETFVAEVIREEDWPVINPGAGMLREFRQVGRNSEIACAKEENTLKLLLSV